MKYIIIYVYAYFSNEELHYWNSLDKLFKKKNYTLIILAPLLPKKKFNFICYVFKARLDEVIIRKDFYNDKPDDFYEKFLLREQVWYGKSSKDRLLAAKTQRANYIDILNETNPTIVLMSNANHAGELIFLEEIKEKGIPVLYFERGCLNKTWHIDERGITAGTEIALKSYSEIKESFIFNTNLYDLFKKNYFVEKETWWSQPKVIEKLDIRSEYNIKKGKRIILFFNQLDNDTSNFLFSPFFKSNLDAFRWFLDQLPKNDFFVLAKKHPLFFGNENEFIESFSKFDIDGVWTNDISLFDCLEQSDYVCAVNSTAIFEAMFYNKPVLQLGKSILSNKDITYELKNLNDLNTVELWIKKNELNYKLLKFKNLIAYLIEHELSFFSNSCLELGFNGPEFMFQKLINKNDSSRIGIKNLSFGHKYQSYFTKEKKIKRFILKSLTFFKKIKYKNPFYLS